MDWNEKRKKRKELRDKIKKLQKEINELREVVSDYQTCQSDINLEIVHWDIKYKTYTGLDLYSPIWMKDKFEGQAAEELGQMIPEAVREIQMTANLMRNVSDGIRDQITLIEEYIEELAAKISELWDQLAALE